MRKATAKCYTSLSGLSRILIFFVINTESIQYTETISYLTFILYSSLSTYFSQVQTSVHESREIFNSSLNLPEHKTEAIYLIIHFLFIYHITRCQDGMVHLLVA